MYSKRRRSSRSAMLAASIHAPRAPVLRFPDFIVKTSSTLRRCPNLVGSPATICMAPSAQLTATLAHVVRADAAARAAGLL